MSICLFLGHPRENFLVGEHNTVSFSLWIRFEKDHSLLIARKHVLSPGTRHNYFRRQRKWLLSRALNKAKVCNRKTVWSTGDSEWNTRKTCLQVLLISLVCLSQSILYVGLGPLYLDNLVPISQYTYVLTQIILLLDFALSRSIRLFNEIIEKIIFI